MSVADAETRLRGRWRVEEVRPGWWAVRRVSHGGSVTKNGDGTRERAEAIFAEMKSNGICRECDDVLSADYVEPERTKILETQTCFSCLHWQGYVATKDNPTHVVVDARHYVIEPDKPAGYQEFRGYGGARFVIRFDDGRDVISHNLWTQGIVPEHFRDRLPDNAVFGPSPPVPTESGDV